MTKPRLTLEEHKELGLALAVMRDDLVRYSTMLANAYPVAGPEAKPHRKLESAYAAIDEARCALENALFDEHRGAETSVYYPDSDRRDAARAGR